MPEAYVGFAQSSRWNIRRDYVAILGIHIA